MSMCESVLVTGACGFLGSEIARLLSRSGYRVTGVGRQVKCAVAGVEYHSMELPDDAIGRLIANVRPEFLVHAAAPASVAASLAEPLSDLMGSVLVQAHLLDAVRRYSPSTQVITLSSAAVYGSPDDLPVSEESPLRPISPYGHHKVMCEMLLSESNDVYGIRSCGLRIFSAYGAGLQRQLLWDLCQKAIANDVVSLYGTGDETRDFIHVDDVAQAVLAIIRNAPFEGEFYNVASGTETTVRDLADRLVSLVAPGRPLEFSGEIRPGDPQRWRADISRIRLLGFSPTWSLDRGVEQYAEWYLSMRARG